MTTPARRQYLEIKARHPDAILFYQVGDFFETFDDDARVASRELQIVLTGRSYGPEEHVPLAGVPVHALETYAAKMVERGYTVAICEQVSPPGRGLVKRDVTRVLTPGTVIDPSMLAATRDTYLAALALKRSRTGDITAAGLAYVDASTGAFACTSWSGAEAADAMRAELHRISASEVLIAERFAAPPSADESETIAAVGAIATPCPPHYFDVENARRRLCRHFDTQTLAAFGCDDQPLAIASAGAVVAYLEHLNPPLLRLISGLRTYDTRGFVEVDGRTWRALEVIESSRAAGDAGHTGRSGSGSDATLLAVLDATRTAMGARALRRTLLHPLTDRLAIEERLDAVSELRSSPALRERLTAALDGLHDLERLVGRVVHGTATSREVYALRDGLMRVPLVVHALQGCATHALAELRATLDPCPEAQSVIERAVVDPVSGDRGRIRRGYDERLDGLAASIDEARRWIASLEVTERQRTGIKSLKVGFNQVFGYYIEVTHPNLALVPADYQRRQTLAHAERYMTPELKENEALVLHAEEQMAPLERSLFADVLSLLARDHARLQATAAALAQVDVWLALATVAVARDFVRPELTDTTELEIVGGRHPIVEAAAPGEFIPNDTHLAALGGEHEGARVMLLTGPNMAGKSTYLRQVATIALLAQIGSFVPARHARIGIVDRIFTRVGADDDLARGISTFMREMIETAYILRHATARSLVILDEVGRGTSTRDGLAIARAVVEYLHTTTRARTLFATHYHELASLADCLPSLRVYQMDVVEREGEPIFLHRVALGASRHSYGVQVARIAGLPGPLTARATELLSGEPAAPAAQGSQIADAAASYTTAGHAASAALAAADPSCAEPVEREVALALASLNIAAMTPVEALNVLFSLQKRALAAISAGGR
jgi:DNA mismatch repair protein MutS